MPLTKENLIRRRFSKAAPRYGVMAQVQKGIAVALAERVKKVKGARVLDVGAGDGVLTKALGQSGATVVSLDAAWGMVRLGKLQGKGCLWLQADACRLPFRKKSFDLLVSSSAYQWVNDLDAAFNEARRVLKPGGRLMVAMFGRATLCEFFESLQCAAVSLKKPLPPIKRLADKEEILRSLASAALTEVEIGVEQREVTFTSVMALLVWLKGIGANSLSSRFFWGKGLMAATENEYRARFMKNERLRASFEVIWIEAKV
ncbi:MAG: methyltransferase domain-containing protein [Candidatus Omnitrophica bacterium]|nr:methyltransferase domain-containing protein [Candidatus Omnitrophota bacterium]